MSSDSDSLPLISAIIPTYNRAHLVSRAIRSVAIQTYQNVEIIVVDDASTDNTRGVVSGINDPRIRYMKHDKNQGLAESRNTGIKASRGTLTGFLDSDDEWLPNKLELQIKRFNESTSDTGVVYGGCFVVDEASGRTLRTIVPRDSGHALDCMLRRNFVMSPTPLVKSECFCKAGTFDRDFRASEDWDMWLRIAEGYRFEFVKEPVAKYYVSSGQMSKDYSRMALSQLKLMAKHEALMNQKPGILAQNYKVVAQLYVLQHEIAAAREYFVRAIRADPHSISLRVHLLMARAMPRVYAALGERLYEYSKSVQGM